MIQCIIDLKGQLHKQLTSLKGACMNPTYPPSKKNVVPTLCGINAYETCGFQFRQEF